VLERPLYYFIRDKFQSIFEKVTVVLGSLDSFFQLDQQVDVSLYLKEATALHHFGGLAGLTQTIVP